MHLTFNVRDYEGGSNMDRTRVEGQLTEDGKSQGSRAARNWRKKKKGQKVDFFF
jgi:hypothetical protein